MDGRTDEGIDEKERERENEVVTALKDSTSSMGPGASIYVTLALVKPWFHQGIKCFPEYGTRRY